jgi:hypothetical protein
MALKQSPKRPQVRSVLAKKLRRKRRRSVHDVRKRKFVTSRAVASGIKNGRRRGNRHYGAAATKADAIRTMWNELGPQARPRDVIRALARRGVTVSAAQVSNLRHTERMVSEPIQITMGLLFAAKRFVEQAGGPDVAKQAIDILARVSCGVPRAFSGRTAGWTSAPEALSPCEEAEERPVSGRSLGLRPCNHCARPERHRLEWKQLSTTGQSICPVRCHQVRLLV